MNVQRSENIIENMRERELDQIIVSSTSSIFYLTGKWIDPGERLLALYLNSDGARKLFVNALFPVEEDPDLEPHVYKDADDPIAPLAETVDPDKPLGIEKVWPSHFLIDLMTRLPGLKAVNGSPAIDETRMVKEPGEIELMRAASAVNDKAMADLAALVPENHSESKMGKLLADIYEKHGTDEFSFDPLIAYGANAAEPHHASDRTTLAKGDSVILDIGGRTKGYCSDMTRTVFYGRPDPKFIDIFNIVREANLAGIAAVRPGARFCDLDRAAREVIEKAGYGEQFTHRLGHNIGIDVHEYPDVGEANEMPVCEGMTFSIEPGIYLPGQCGVRLEDLVVVTENGCEVLNRYPKDLQVF